eukprot:scaffold106115_cov66-Phaeocystis_antarctica.AAC.6
MAHCWRRVHVEEAAMQRRYVPAVDGVSSTMPPSNCGSYPQHGRARGRPKYLHALARCNPPRV